MRKLILIILLGLAIRIISISQSLWLDEATSVLVARDFTFGDILTKFSPGDFHPPLYYLMLKAWILLFGSTEIIVRTLSVLFGIATIPVVYGIGKKIFSKDIGLVSALFLATAPLHIYYSQEARMYAMEALLAAIVVYFVIMIFQSKKPKLLHYFGLTILSAVLLYTDYLPIFLLLSMFIFLIIYHRKYFLYYAGWALGVVALFIPWIPTLLYQFQSGILVEQSTPIWWVTLGRTSIKEVILVPIKFIIGRISSHDKIFYSLSVALASTPFIISSLNSLKESSKIKLLLFWLLLPAIFAAIFGIFASSFSYFRLIFVLPAFYLLLSFGAFSFNGKTRNVLIGGMLLVNFVSTGVYLFVPRFHREDWRSAVSFIEENSYGRNAATFFVGKGQQEAYNYYMHSVKSFDPKNLSSSFDTIWLMRYVQPIFDPKDLTRLKIEEMGYKKLNEHDFNGVVVWRYEK